MMLRGKHANAFGGLTRPEGWASIMLFAAVACCNVNVVEADASSACGAVLSQGVYNIAQTSSSRSSASQATQTLCTTSSSYTYTQYVNDQSSSSASSQSRANSVDVSAEAFGYKAKVGVSSSSSSMTASEFNAYMNAANTAQQSSSACGGSSSSSSGDQNFASLIKNIDPSVYAAYQSCLALYSSGIQISEVRPIGSTGYQSSSVTIGITYKPSTGVTSSARMTAINFAPADGSASCTLSGVSKAGSPPTGRRQALGAASVSPPSPFALRFPHPVKKVKFPGYASPVELVPNAVYSLYCAISDTAAPNGGYSDIYLSFDSANPYATRLARNVSISQVAALQGQIQTLQASLQSTSADERNQIQGLQALLQRTNMSIQALQAIALSPPAPPPSSVPLSCPGSTPVPGWTFVARYSNYVVSSGAWTLVPGSINSRPQDLSGAYAPSTVLPSMCKLSDAQINSLIGSYGVTNTTLMAVVNNNFATARFYKFKSSSGVYTSKNMDYASLCAAASAAGPWSCDTSFAGGGAIGNAECRAAYGGTCLGLGSAQTTETSALLGWCGAGDGFHGMYPGSGLVIIDRCGGVWEQQTQQSGSSGIQPTFAKMEIFIRQMN